MLFFSFKLHTYWSSHHIIHEGTQTPPVDSSIVTWPGQDLWSPERVKKTSQVVVSKFKPIQTVGACIISALLLTCILWCHRRCVWRFHHEWIPCRGRSLLTWCVLKKTTHNSWKKTTFCKFFVTFYFSKNPYIWVLFHVQCVTLMIEHDVFRF